MRSFQEFVQEFRKTGYVISEENISDPIKNEVGQVWENTIDFLEKNKLVSSHENLNDFNVKAETVDTDLAGMSHNEIIAFVESCKVEPKYVIPTAEAVALTIHKYRSGSVQYDHFNNNHDEAIIGNAQIKDLSDLYNSNLLNAIYYDNPATSMESFGVNIDKTISDVRMAIAVTVLKFGKGILPRLLHNRPTDSNVVLYKVDHKTTYDFNKSGDQNAEERYEGSHIVPFVDLYGNPSVVDMSSVPVIVKEANDTSEDFVMVDGYLYTGKRANLHDLSRDSSTPGYDYVDYTDLISDGAKLSKLVLRVHYDDGTNTYDEDFLFDVAEKQGSRFVMTANVSDAADRVAVLNDQVAIQNTTPKMDGTNSTIAGMLDANHFVAIDLNVQGNLNLRTAFCNVLGSATAKLKTKDGSTPIPAMQTIFNNIKSITVLAYALDATFNEENFRKTTLAAVLRTKMVGYEIKGTRNVLLSLSHKQTKPDDAITALNEMIRIGNDYKGVKLIIDCMQRVYNAVKQEEALNTPFQKRIMNDFVAGYTVKPYIYIDSINISSELKNMRSAEALGDARGLAEKKLLEILTVIYNKSFFIQALPQGQRPVFKVLTSGYVLDALFNVPFYKTIPDQPEAEKAGNDVIEYRRTIGQTELQFVTTTWDMMTDKMIIIPFISNDPESELNFGHLWDRGVFVAQITPYINRASFKEIIANQREMPIVTNPIGAMITVNGLSHIFDGIAGLGI